MQVLMAAGAAADAIEEPAAEDSTRVLMAGWELFSGASHDPAVRVLGVAHRGGRDAAQ